MVFKWGRPEFLGLKEPRKNIPPDKKGLPTKKLGRGKSRD